MYLLIFHTIVPYVCHHLTGYRLGENLFYSSVPHSWVDVITAWQNELSNYSYGKGSTNGQPVGHYTLVTRIAMYVNCFFKGAICDS